MVKDFPLRQVHLDFHTSPHIPGVGGKFDKAQFQAALKAAHAESVTVFAKCHHGLCYYPTEVGTMHPQLDFDLTGAMVEAAHEIGVRAPIYITAGWSDLDAKRHPEWIARNQDGSQFGSPAMLQCEGRREDAPREEVAWDILCLNDGEYCRHIYALTEEVCKRYARVDGLFFDICAVGKACYCPECVKGVEKTGLDAEAYFVEKRAAFMEKCGAILRKYHPGATIFFNSGGASMYKPAYHGFQSHFEMEDLPTAWDGYDRLPLRARYFQRLGKPCIGMTGKFHLAWGEFGGFKCREALKYEVCAMALFGVGCSVGDHMHPDGQMEMQTYENIGHAYGYLEAITPYCYGGENTARLGMLVSDKPEVNLGISKILLENQLDFDVAEDDFERFEAVIVPEGLHPKEETVAALRTYAAGGGKVLFCADALVKDGAFQLDCGAEYLGPPEYDCDYIVTELAFRQELPKAPMLCNLPAHRVARTDGWELASVQTPYFSRTMARFCGHKNTPHDKTTSQPGILRKGNVVYMAHPMASAYNTYGSLYQKRYFMLALEQIYGGGAFRVEGMGSMGRATMIRQRERSRYCLNLLYAAPVKRGKAEVIEDILPVYDIKITLDIPETIHRAFEPLTGQELPVRLEGGKQMLTLPKLLCHSSIVLEY